MTDAAVAERTLVEFIQFIELKDIEVTFNEVIAEKYPLLQERDKQFIRTVWKATQAFLADSALEFIKIKYPEYQKLLDSGYNG